MVVRDDPVYDNTIFSSSVRGGFGFFSFGFSPFSSPVFESVLDGFASLGDGFFGASGFLTASFGLGLKAPKIGDGA